MKASSRYTHTCRRQKTAAGYDLALGGAACAYFLVASVILGGGPAVVFVAGCILAGLLFTHRAHSRLAAEVHDVQAAPRPIAHRLAAQWTAVCVAVVSVLAIGLQI